MFSLGNEKECVEWWSWVAVAGTFTTAEAPTDFIRLIIICGGLALGCSRRRRYHYEIIKSYLLPYYFG
ncbi:hypothetical protein HanRHA438_Chr11g0506631 [Helianthus annuus]|nr:hypothetical protein HanRHA438_Chr11g0506631 [Helianthus annuus]